MGRCLLLLLVLAAAASPREVAVRLAKSRVVKMDLEDYVAAVVAGEGNTLHGEAQAALAVAARSYAVHNAGRHRGEGFDFCDTTHCQDLRLAAVNERAQAAAGVTEGELLWYDGAVANAFYSLDCAGQTEGLPGVPYLRAQADTFCVTRGRRRWQARLEGVKQAVVWETSASGRVRTLRVDGRVVAWDGIEGALSSLFTLHGLTLQGYGAGHGLGLCQVGADERARAGHSWRQILSFYYPGTRAGLTPQGIGWTRLSSERWELFTVNPGLDARLLGMAGAALAEAERRTGWRWQGQARLKVYPSVAAFRDATGEPGWVVASTLGRTVRLQPYRAGLEGVLLHECLHLLVNQRARGELPEWFREGVALWLDNQEAARSPEYARWRARVRQLAEAYGAATVLGWVERGLPSGISDSSVTQKTTKKP
jgi:stage II sporulation protein D